MAQNGVFTKRAKNPKKRRKKAKNDEKIRFFGHFFKSSKKNFNFALIRPFFGGRAQPLHGGSENDPFWIETIQESVLRVPIRLLLSDAFFFGPGGPLAGPPKIDIFAIFVIFVNFGLFLAIFGHFWCFSWFWPFWCFWLILGCFWCF